MLKYYLSHPHAHKREVRDWQLRFQEKTGCRLVNPFYDLTTEASDDRVFNGDYVEVVCDDLDAIRHSDGVLCRVFDDWPMIGNSMELVYAFRHKVPVYTHAPDSLKGHYWLRYHSDTIFTAFYDLENFVKREVSLCERKRRR